MRYFRPEQTIILFDWDDTLCPSNWIREAPVVGMLSQSFWVKRQQGVFVKSIISRWVVFFLDWPKFPTPLVCRQPFFESWCDSFGGRRIVQRWVSSNLVLRKRSAHWQIACVCWSQAFVNRVKCFWDFQVPATLAWAAKTCGGLQPSWYLF